MTAPSSAGSAGDVEARAMVLSAQFAQAAERCCQCTDGHHDWIPAYPYGTDGDVRMTRDLAREVSVLLGLAARAVAADRERLAEAVETLTTLGEQVATVDEWHTGWQQGIYAALALLAAPHGDRGPAYVAEGTEEG